MNRQTFGGRCIGPERPAITPETKQQGKNMKTTSQEYQGEVSVCAHRVSFRYWDFDAQLNSELEQELADHAEERAKECIIEGCSSGQLNFFHTDTEEEIGGWWEINRA